MDTLFSNAFSTSVWIPEGDGRGGGADGSSSNANDDTNRNPENTIHHYSYVRRKILSSSSLNTHHQHGNRYLQSYQPYQDQQDNESDHEHPSSQQEFQAQRGPASDYNGTVSILVILLTIICILSLPNLIRLIRNRLCPRRRSSADEELERAVMRRLRASNLIPRDAPAGSLPPNWPIAIPTLPRIRMSPTDRKEYISNVLAVKHVVFLDKTTLKPEQIDMSRHMVLSSRAAVADDGGDPLKPLKKVPSFRAGSGSGGSPIIKRSKSSTSLKKIGCECIISRSRSSNSLSNKADADEVGSRGKATSGGLDASGNNDPADDEDLEQQQQPLDHDENCCAICLTEYEDGDAVCMSNNAYCNHYFHADCIREWLMSHEECPCCRHFFLFFVNDQDDLALYEGATGEREQPVHQRGSSTLQLQQQQTDDPIRQNGGAAESSSVNAAVSNASATNGGGNGSSNHNSNTVSSPQSRSRSNSGLRGFFHMRRPSSSPQHFQQQQRNQQSQPQQQSNAINNTTNVHQHVPPNEPDYSVDDGSVNSVLDRMMNLFDDARSRSGDTATSTTTAASNTMNDGDAPSLTTNYQGTTAATTATTDSSHQSMMDSRTTLNTAVSVANSDDNGVGVPIDDVRACSG